jgi:iron-siderophore transport system substrate-binding protein
VYGRHTRRRLALGMLVAAALLLTACGSDEGGEAGEADEGGSQEPVTIEHAFGETTLQEPPERVVTLGAQWTDVVLALDEQPVAYLVDPMAGDQGLFAWEENIADDAEGIEATDSIPLERVASMNPDLILVTYAVTEQEQYDELNAIAPTIGMLGDRDVDRWQDMLAVGGEIFGKQDRAAEIEAEVQGMIDDTAAELPGLEGKSFAMANYVAGDAIYVIADPEDGASQFFQQLGLEIAPAVMEAADGVTGRAEFGLEQASLLDADLLVIYSGDADPSELVGYDSLPAVQSGAVAEMDYASVVGLNTPSALSLPYSMDFVRPALDAAAGAEAEAGA